MLKSIILSFYKESDSSEHTLEIKGSDVAIFKLFDITETVRYNHGNLTSHDVVHQLVIAVKNTSEVFKSLGLNDADLEEIKIIEDNDKSRTFSVKLDRKIDVEFGEDLLIFRKLKKG